MKRALLVIDVQNEYFSGALPVSYSSGTLEHVLEVMDVATQQGIAVVVVRHPELADNTPFSKRALQNGSCILQANSKVQQPRGLSDECFL